MITHPTEITCTRRVQFCAGHRVVGHEGKCVNLHGHNYVAMFTATATELDNIGRIIDFSVLKGRIGGWIEQHWDHGFVMWEKDSPTIAAIQAFDAQALQQQKIYPLPVNPTAENMARFLLAEVCPEQLNGTGVTVVGVRLWETENCYADAVLGESKAHEHM